MKSSIAMYGVTTKTVGVGQIIDAVSIDERPEIVDKKSRIGDWEIDTVIGKNYKQAIVTIVERASKFSVMKKWRRKWQRQWHQPRLSYCVLTKIGC